MDTDQAISQVIDGCLVGEESAVENLIRTLTPLVQRLTYSILDDPAEADEATQDVLVRVVDHLDTFRREASFTTWVSSIALNVCRARLRRRRTRARLMEHVQGMFRSSSAPMEHPEERAIQNEEEAAVWRALHILTESQREMLILRYFLNLRLAEIGQICGVSERTVRSRIHAAHDRLRELLSDHA